MVFLTNNGTDVLVGGTILEECLARAATHARYLAMLRRMLTIDSQSVERYRNTIPENQ
jgi:hypothetical protein